MAILTQAMTQGRGTKSHIVPLRKHALAYELARLSQDYPFLGGEAWPLYHYRSLCGVRVVVYRSQWMTPVLTRTRIYANRTCSRCRAKARFRSDYPDVERMP